MLQDPGFLTTEALGTDPPRRCKTCANCKECQFRTNLLSAKENAEYDIIVSNLKFDEKNGKWSTAYPFIEHPMILKDNYGQAYACMKSLENKLIKKGKLSEFNDAFSDIVSRGVFRELTQAEMNEWRGPVNYISIVVAYKSDPHAMTPIRLCMNSAMKQPPPPPIQKFK